MVTKFIMIACVHVKSINADDMLLSGLQRNIRDMKNIKKSHLTIYYIV